MDGINSSRGWKGCVLWPGTAPSHVSSFLSLPLLHTVLWMVSWLLQQRLLCVASSALRRHYCSWGACFHVAVHIFLYGHLPGFPWSTLYFCSLLVTLCHYFSPFFFFNLRAWVCNAFWTRPFVDCFVIYSGQIDHHKGPKMPSLPFLFLGVVYFF